MPAQVYPFMSISFTSSQLISTINHVVTYPEQQSLSSSSRTPKSNFNEDVLTTAIDLRRFRVKAHIIPNSKAVDAGSSPSTTTLEYYIQGGEGSSGPAAAVILRDDFEPCRWHSNWMLNLLSNALCRNPSEAARKCDLKTNLYRILEKIALRSSGQLFSAKGFMSKFLRLCEGFYQPETAVGSRQEAKDPFASASSTTVTTVVVKKRRKKEPTSEPEATAAVAKQRKSTPSSSSSSTAPSSSSSYARVPIPSNHQSSLKRLSTMSTSMSPLSFTSNFPSQTGKLNVIEDSSSSSSLSTFASSSRPANRRKHPQEPKLASEMEIREGGELRGDDDKPTTKTALTEVEIENAEDGTRQKSGILVAETEPDLPPLHLETSFLPVAEEVDSFTFNPSNPSSTRFTLEATSEADVTTSRITTSKSTSTTTRRPPFMFVTERPAFNFFPTTANTGFNFFRSTTTPAAPKRRPAFNFQVSSITRETSRRPFQFRTTTARPQSRWPNPIQRNPFRTTIRPSLSLVESSSSTSFFPSSPFASPSRPSSPPAAQKAESSAVGKYLNMMDDLVSPEMIRYRLRLMFKELMLDDSELREIPESVRTSSPEEKSRLMQLKRFCR